jgi:hypothetical protein
MHLEHKICKELISKKPDTIIYTSLAYRQDKKRRALGLLCKNGFYKKIGGYTYQRTNKLNLKNELEQ